MKYRLICICLLPLWLISCHNNSKEKIEKSKFGVTAQQDTVYKYALYNQNGMQIAILNYGGVIQSIKTPDKNGEMADIALGFNEIGKYQKYSPYFGALIGRFGNRIAKGAFTLNDSTYHLNTNDGLNSLHGGDEGFDKKIWDTSPLVTDSTQGLKLHYHRPDGEEGYPGNLDITVTYTLNNDNELRIDYKATTDKPTILNPTNHTYFNLSGGKDSINDYKLTLNADYFLPVDSTLIPTGEERKVAGTPLDFREPTKIGRHINDRTKQLQLANGGYDFCWVLNKPHTLKQRAVKVYDPKTGRTLKVFTTQPGIQFYSGNMLDGSLIGKNDTKYPKHSAIVLETQHFPDSPNQPKFPSTVLNPGETFHSSTIYKFGVKKGGD